MKEIRFHGRGGQGAVVATRILADAFFKEGRAVQAFPFFGVERRGAPVTAFVRIDDKDIRIRSEVYEPDYVVILDPSLIEVVDCLEGIKPKGIVLINTNKSPKEFNLGKGVKVTTVNAKAIALKYKLGTQSAPIVNTAILGAFSRAIGEVSLDSILDSIKQKISIKTDANIKAAREAYKKVKE